MSKVIKILVADNQPIFRRGLHTLFANEPGLELLGEAENSKEAVEKARSLGPDLLLIDLMTPD